MIASFLRGALAGLMATAPMTLVMALMHRELPLQDRHSLPPKKITMRLLGRTGQRSRLNQDWQRHGLALAAHFGYGSAMGAAYAPLAQRLGLPAVASGIGFGLVVWCVSYLGLLPALGLFPPPQRSRSVAPRS